jgi:hypothetical protein
MSLMTIKRWKVATLLPVAVNCEFMLRSGASPTKNVMNIRRQVTLRSNSNLDSGRIGYSGTAFQQRKRTLVS